MDSLLNISPGLMIWTLINFTLFILIVYKFGGKLIVEGMKLREDRIQSVIDRAEEANATAEKLMKESQEKFDKAQQEVADAVQKGRELADKMIQKATDEADKVKQSKIEEAIREIDRNKNHAIKELRNEVAYLVIEATEKILNEKLDKDKHYKLVESYLDKIPKN